MGHTLHSQIGIAVVVLSCLFCWIKGGAAERLGASFIFAANAVDTLIGFLTNPHFPYLAVFAVDFMLATALLVLAIRYNSIWVGAAMLLQGAELAWYAMQATGESFDRHQYAHWVNIQTGLMLLSMVGGAVAAWRQRIQRRRERGVDRPSATPAPV